MLSPCYKNLSSILSARSEAQEPKICPNQEKQGGKGPVGRGHHCSPPPALQSALGSLEEPEQGLNPQVRAQDRVPEKDPHAPIQPLAVPG